MFDDAGAANPGAQRTERRDYFLAALSKPTDVATGGNSELDLPHHPRHGPADYRDRLARLGRRARAQTQRRPAAAHFQMDLYGHGHWRRVLADQTQLRTPGHHHRPGHRLVRRPGADGYLAAQHR